MKMSRNGQSSLMNPGMRRSSIQLRTCHTFSKHGFVLVILLPRPPLKTLTTLNQLIPLAQARDTGSEYAAEDVSGNIERVEPFETRHIQDQEPHAPFNYPLGSSRLMTRGDFGYVSMRSSNKQVVILTLPCTTVYKIKRSDGCFFARKVIPF